MRSTTSLHALGTWLGLALLLAGSAGAQYARPGPSTMPPEWAQSRQQGRYCDAAPVQSFVGRDANVIVLEQARQAAGANRVVTLGPGVGITAAVIEGRLLLGVDAAGKITSADCA